MTTYTQKELISESFWTNFQKPFRAVGGLAGAAVKGTAKALDYVAPELTQPLHRLEAGVRDIGNAARIGYDAGSGGLMKVYKDKLLDAGYIMDESKGITKSGKNNVVIGSRIVGHNSKGPYGDPKRSLSFIFDHSNNFKIINTSAQDTSRLNTPSSRGKYKNRARSKK